MAEPPAISQANKRTSFWTPAMQDHCVQLFGPEDPALQAISADAKNRGYPPIAVSAADGQALRVLVTLARARSAVEIGTLGGYSALWIARALQPGGHLDCFEIDPDRAQFAREHIMTAHPPAVVSVHVGPALENLKNVTGPVDFVFIDADKGNYPAYLAWAADHLNSGGIVALDNAFAWGGVVDPGVLGERESEARAMRATLEALARDPRFTAAMIPTNEGLAVGVRK